LDQESRLTFRKVQLRRQAGREFWNTMLGPMTLQHQFESGMSHHDAGRLAEAEAIYRQILSQNPNHVEALHLLGLIAGQRGNHDQAIDLIGRAIRLKPDFRDAYNNRGFAKDMLDDSQGAAADRKYALELGKK